MTRVLLIEDEPAARHVLVSTLAHLGYDTRSADTGAQGLRLVAEDSPDLVVLDLGLPDLPGIEVIRRLREWSDVPVVVVSGSTLHRRKADALDAGADDFLDKPFGVAELRARLRALERRLVAATTDGSMARTFGRLAIDPILRTVTRDGDEVRLTETEWLLVGALSAHPGRVMTHRSLIGQVWGTKARPEAATSLRSHLRALRGKLGDDAREPTYIRTESGVGYRWICPPTPVALDTDPPDQLDPVHVVHEMRRQLEESLRTSGRAVDPRLDDLTDQMVELVSELVARERTP